MRGLSLASIVLLHALLASSSTLAQAFPALMQTARRLIVVTVPTLTSTVGGLRLFKRGRSDASWSLVGAPEPVMLGSGGVAWGRAFRSFAADDEPIKIEGDKRSPAGFYAIGRPFGFAPSPLAGYLQLQSDSICVREPVVSGLQHDYVGKCYWPAGWHAKHGSGNTLSPWAYG